MALKNLRERDVVIDTTLLLWWLIASVSVIWNVWGDHQFQITGKCENQDKCDECDNQDNREMCDSEL